MPFVRKAPTKKSRASKALASKQYVKRVVNRATAFDKDTYYLDNQTLSPTTSQQYIDLSAGAHTSGTISGIGMENINLVIKGFVHAADNPNFVRLVLFKWRNDTANATPGSNDVLRNDASATAPFGLPHWERRGDYKIIADRLIHVASSDTSTPLTKSFSINVSAKKLGMSRFNQGANTGRDHLYLMYVSDSNVVSHPTVDYNLRLIYKADE